MSDRWFRLPQTGSGTPADPYRPAHLDRSGIDGWAGNTAHPDGAPAWVVRVYGDASTLDAVASEPQAVELSSVPTQALNQMFGQERDAAGWEEGFRVGD